MPNAAPSSWRMFLPLGIVLVLALIWSICWFVALGIAKERFAAEREILANQGAALSCTQEDWGGYPFHLEYSCRSPVATIVGRAELRSSNLLLVALAYAPWQIAALLDGPTTVSGLGLSPTKVDHQRVFAAITFKAEEVPTVSLELPALSVSGFGKLKQLMLSTRPSPTEGMDLAITITGLEYQSPDHVPLTVDSGSLLSSVVQDQTLKVQKFELQQGTLRYWGSGTLRLDSNHRITGKLDTETNDISGLLAVLAPHLTLSAAQISNLKTMLGLLGNAAKAPVIAQDGALYIGPFKIADLTAIY